MDKKRIRDGALDMLIGMDRSDLNKELWDLSKAMEDPTVSDEVYSKQMSGFIRDASLGNR